MMTLATLAASAVLGWTAEPELTKTKIVDATIFKNGSAVTIHQVTVPSSGEVLIEEPPIAALGTLWIYAGGNAKISSVVMTQVKGESERTIRPDSIGGALALNSGKAMEIVYSEGGVVKTIAGTLLEVSGSLAIFTDAQEKRVFLALGSILSFRGDGDLTYTRVVKDTTMVPALRVKATPGAKVNLMGLQAGMTWVPAYQVDISDKTKLKMVSKATVVNDLGDLDGVTARLVTGFPNLTTMGQWDPLTYVGSIMRGGGNGGMAPGAAMTQNAAPMRRESASDSSFGSFEPNVGEGFSGEDLFFTPLKDLLLKQGERGYYVLFQTESPYSHLYTLGLPPSMAEGGDRDYSSEELPVWHEIEFDNTMKQPWTTGTALVMQNGEMLGTDELKYTTPGTKAYLKISKALDVAADVREEEVSRERGAIKDRFNNATHDLVTVKGTMELINYKGLEIQMKISKQIEGEVVSAEGSERTFKTAKRLNQVNPTSVIEWRPKLAKGAKRTFEYTYSVYVSAR